MAYADGTVVIDTEIDTDGIQAGSKEVEARIRNLARKVNNIGATAKAALNKQIDAFAKMKDSLHSILEKNWQEPEQYYTNE